MIGGIWIIALLVQILFAIAGVATENFSCADYFRYTRKLRSNEIIGIIRIPPSLALDRTWFIHISMYIDGIIPKEKRCTLSLSLPGMATVRRIRQGRSLEFEESFPQGTVGVPYRIKFNKHLLCNVPLPQDRKVTLKEDGGLFVLPPRLYKTLLLRPTELAPTWPAPVQRASTFPRRRQIWSDPTEAAPTLPDPELIWSDPTEAAPTLPDPELIWSDSTEAAPTLPVPTKAAPTWSRPTEAAPTLPVPTKAAPTWSRPTEAAPTLPVPTKAAPTWLVPTAMNSQLRELTPAFNQDCGRSSYSVVDRLIFRGNQTFSGQWPWIVAIFARNDFNILSFQCGGSLVSNTHIVTAAHCFRSGNSTLSADVFQVALGRFRLGDWQKTDSENRNIAEYKLHPDYDPTKAIADADLAIIVLSKSVEYSAKIKPICLWSGTADLNAIVGMLGCLVGWGEDENGHRYLDEPRMTRELIVDQEDCLRSHPFFASITSRRTFCAGSRKGTGPCYGDSGSGLIVYDSTTNRYYLRGVVSMNLRDTVSASCDQSHYSIYVDVAKHLQWVRRQIAA